MILGDVSLASGGVILPEGNTPSGILVGSGSTETVLSGGTATGTVVSNGGYEVVSFGGIARGTALQAGAMITMNTGASTVTGGSGADVFGLVKGHAGGSETIYNFNSSDKLAFSGYGYTATNLPAETVMDGNDVMALTDGTVITFIGIDHKLF